MKYNGHNVETVHILLLGTGGTGKYELKLLIKYELSTVLVELWIDIVSRVGEIFIMIPGKAFTGLAVMTLADLLQQPPVREKRIFSRFSDKDPMKHLLGLQLWHLFKYAKLTEIVRQNHKLLIDFLNKVRVGNNDDGAKNNIRIWKNK